MLPALSQKPRLRKQDLPSHSRGQPSQQLLAASLIQAMRRFLPPSRRATVASEKITARHLRGN